MKRKLKKIMQRATRRAVKNGLSQRQAKIRGKKATDSAVISGKVMWD